METQKMKRSDINRLLKESLELFDKMNFRLPQWATWKIEDWKKNKDIASEILECSLGWDITDFGCGNFSKKGLILFTIRNGKLNGGHKNYCEKIIISGENQICPMHFHFVKTEDIINRSGGNLLVQLYHSTEDGGLSDAPVTVSIDGLSRTFNAGEVVILKPGDSITIEPFLYHTFWAEEATGKVLVGEVSKVNDDKNDNRFYEKVGRFPEIVEDEDPLCLLVNDYNKFLKN